MNSGNEYFQKSMRKKTTPDFFSLERLSFSFYKRKIKEKFFTGKGETTEKQEQNLTQAMGFLLINELLRLLKTGNMSTVPQKNRDKTEALLKKIKEKKDPVAWLNDIKKEIQSGRRKFLTAKKVDANGKYVPYYPKFLEFFVRVQNALQISPAQITTDEYNNSANVGKPIYLGNYALKSEIHTEAKKFSESLLAKWDSTSPQRLAVRKQREKKEHEIFLAHLPFSNPQKPFYSEAQEFYSHLGFYPESIEEKVSPTGEKFLFLTMPKNNVQKWVKKSFLKDTKGRRIVAQISNPTEYSLEASKIPTKKVGIAFHLTGGKMARDSKTLDEEHIDGIYATNNAGVLIAQNGAVIFMRDTWKTTGFGSLGPASAKVWGKGENKKYIAVEMVASNTKRGFEQPNEKQKESAQFLRKYVNLPAIDSFDGISRHLASGEKAPTGWNTVSIEGERYAVPHEAHRDYLTAASRAAIGLPPRKETNRLLLAEKTKRETILLASN